MKGPLISTVSELNDERLKELVEFYNETLGFCPNSIKTMYHRPRIAFAFIEMNKAVMENKGSVTSDLKRLIGYVSSRVAGCRYCQAHTIRAAERYGASKDKLDNIWEFETHPAFAPAERVALDFAVKASIHPNSVDETVQDQLRQYWTEGEIVEITAVVALFGFLNRWNDSMATLLESPAHQSAAELLKKDHWEAGKHQAE
ncbi:MAG: carboxymuconolactone decarboxylase family protein [Saprospirales bacterium]|nr:MAG: carboxymuconolactone decarboxylase family protein [Saprospirales bacterium]